MKILSELKDKYLTTDFNRTHVGDFEMTQEEAQELVRYIVGLEQVEHKRLKVRRAISNFAEGDAGVEDTVDIITRVFE